MTFNIISNGDPGDANKIMENYRHVNYGNVLLPVNNSGVGIDESLDIGSNISRWKSALIYNLNLKTVTVNFAASPFAADNEGRLLVDTTAGAVTINLPTAVGIIGRQIGIMKTDSVANEVIIDGNGSETIEGNLTASLGAKNNFVLLESDGANWNVTSRYLKKINNIGDWNMDTLGRVTLPHGLADQNKVDFVTVIIREDLGIIRLTLDSIDFGISAKVGGAVRQIDGTNILLDRFVGEVFDNTGFDSTSFNRGFIVFDLSLI